MKMVNTVLGKIIAAEWGYQNHPEDTGNWYKGKNLGTKHGITPKALAKHLGRDVTEKDIRGVTPATALAIFKKEYVSGIKRSIQPHRKVLPQLVDMNVNHGYKNTVKMYQRAVGTKVDGRMGPKTRAKASSIDPTSLNNTLVDVRKDFYRNIVKSRPNQKIFLNGWLKRAESYRRSRWN